MKISLALGPRQPLSRETAWGCLTSNLAAPGAGSLLAGRRSGYGQLTLAMGGLLATTIFGVRFMLWMVANWSRFYGAGADPDLLEMWLHLRWALLGFGLFGAALLWALGTSLSILGDAQKSTLPPSPPPLL